MKDVLTGLDNESLADGIGRNAEKEFFLTIAAGLLVVIILSLISAALFRKAATTKTFADAFFLFLVVFGAMAVVIVGLASQIR